MRLAIAGAAGRMGQALIRAARASADFEIVGGTARTPVALDMPVSADPAEAAKSADIWIDFTAPDATIAALKPLERTPVRAAIIGATGLDDSHEQAIAAAAKRIAIVRSGNFSAGVTLLAVLVEEAARRLGPAWDIEILEAHHRRKIDAPSGTALLLGEAAAKGRSAKLRDLRTPARDGLTGARKEGTIGFASLRAGGIVGEHEVAFASETEIVRLSHEALDRSIFADGALLAARWAYSKPPGLYSMRDVLGL